MSLASRAREAAKRLAEIPDFNSKPRNPTARERLTGAQGLSTHEWMLLRSWQRHWLQEAAKLNGPYLPNACLDFTGQRVPATYPEPITD